MSIRIPSRSRPRAISLAIAFTVMATALVVGLSTRSTGTQQADGAPPAGQPLDADTSVDVTWMSPPPQTSSRFLVYDVQFSEPVRGITAGDFVSDGGECSFTVPVPSTEYALKFSILMTCPPLTFGTVSPRLVTETVSTRTLDATPIGGELSGRSVEIIPGSVMTVGVTGSGAGVVTSDLSGISCGLLCTGAFPPGTRLTLTARPEPGNVFVGWSGACSGTAACTLTLSSSRTVTAQFEPAGSIIVTKVGSGAGSVAARSTQLNCGNVCRSSHRVGQTVTVTATPTRTSRFVGWIGACSGTGSCVVNVASTDDYFLYAIFEPR